VAKVLSPQDEVFHGALIPISPSPGHLQGHMQGSHPPPHAPRRRRGQLLHLP
jgi:hypothetical protein